MAGVPWVRVNTEDFARNVELTINPVGASGGLRVRDSGRYVDLREVRAVWFRKPEPVDVSHFALDPAALDYIEAEFTEILFGLYALLRHLPWINDPFRTRIAHRKMLQLHVAAKVGFTTPRTIVTNNAGVALRFSQEVGGDLAIKSLGALCVTQDAPGGALQYGIFTRKVSPAELKEAREKIPCMPTLFQEFVKKKAELRVTCVGERVFACRIEPENGSFPDDSRFNIRALRHHACECRELYPMLHAYMREFGLEFACFDIMVSETGQFIFCEANPNAQWLWVDNLTGLPIGQAVAEQLTVGAGNGGALVKEPEVAGAARAEG